MVDSRKATNGASAGTSKAAVPAAKRANGNQTATTGVGGLMNRLGSVLAPRGRGAGGAGKPARPPSPWNKLLFGAMVYLLGSLLLQPLIILLFSWFHISPTARQPFFPANTPLIGNANVYTLVYFVFLAVFIWLLFRFNIIPRDPFGVRANAQRPSGAASTGTSGATSVTETPTALRHAGKRRLPTTAASTNAKPSRLAARPPTTKALPRAATGVAARSAAKAPATKPTAKAVSASANSSTNGGLDSHYDRVKSQQRARRRKR